MKNLARLLTAFAFLAANRANAQNLIANGTFDVNDPGSGFFCGPVYSWISGNGGVQWEDQWNGDGDTWWVDLTGCGWGNDHWIEQTIRTKAGNHYTLNFDLGCWNGQYYTTAGVDLFINGDFVDNYTFGDFSGNELAWQKFSHCFIADKEEATIRFVGRGEMSYLTPSWCNPITNYVGVIGLDNVSVVEADGKIEYTSHCAPAFLEHHSQGGTAYWWSPEIDFFEGNTLYVEKEGTYMFSYLTECGWIEDQIVLQDCSDTCWMEPDFHVNESLDPDTLVLCKGDFLYFHGFSNTNAALEYAWDFGDGIATNYSLEPLISHRYLQPGYYTVCMTVWLKPNGQYIPPCGPYTMCKTIYVKDCSEKPTEEEGGGWLPNDPGGEGTKILTMGSDAPLSIFPNPVSDELTIRGLTDGETVTEIAVCDLSGRLVMSKAIAAGKGEVRLSVRELKAGAYVLKVKGQTYDGEVKFIRK
jgi:hypothetical protein